MRNLVVENIMSEPVYSVDGDTTAESALKEMQKHGTKKILVRDGQTPKGVLEAWKITKSDYKLKVSQIPLSDFEVVPKGTELSEIKQQLLKLAAVYVSDSQDKSKLIGVVTSFDFVGAI